MAPRKKTTVKKETKVEETKEPEYNFDNEMKNEDFQRKIRKLLKLAIGGLFCVGGIWLIVRYWANFITIFKEWIGVFLILIGFFVLLLGMLD